MTNSTSLPRIVLTMGEAAGVGPELIVRLSQLAFEAQLIVLADRELLRDVAEKVDIQLALSDIDWNSAVEQHKVGHLWIEHHSCKEPVVAGKLSKNNALTTYQILQRSSELALDGNANAIVTAPVHKANLNSVDKQFLGHTEFFAQLANVEQVVMMLATLSMRMTLATTHIPLSEVSSAITPNRLKNTINIILSSLKKLTGKDAKMAVCGLNPHAGEDGLLGDEEQLVIAPVIREMQGAGFDLNGPFPADTLFTPQKLKQFDVFLAMYHDQGLPVIKASGFGQCANVTLGLPYIRTSVDHGTALDIAADYCASAESLEFAVNYAIELASGNLPS